MAIQKNRVRVTSKGQLTLRRRLLDHVGAKPGDQLDIVELPGGRLEVRATSKGSIEAFFGSLKHDGTAPLSIDEINNVIAKSWSGER